MIALSWSIKAAVDEATQRLSDSRTESPRLDAEVLMGFILGWPRARLFAHWDEVLPEGDLACYRELVRRRAAGQPVAYIRNLKEFMGLEFYVDSRVLIPRPETELLVSRGVAWLTARDLRRTIADIGTGCGAIAIAIAIARHLPECRVVATDISQDALDVARINAERNGVTLDLRQGSLLEPIDEPVDLIVANLPYLSRDEYENVLDTSIAYEPRQALTDEADGNSLMDELLGDVTGRLAPGGCILLEIGTSKPSRLPPNFEATVFADYAGLPRVLQLQS